MDGIKSMKKKIIYVTSLLAVITIILLTVCAVMFITSDNLADTLNELEVEVSDIPVTVLYSTVDMGDRECNALELLVSDDKYQRIDRYICKYDDRIYFIYCDPIESSDKWTWNICSVNIYGEQLIVHRSQEFISAYRYTSDSMRYSDKSSFFDRGNIVITDGTTVCVYDVEEGGVSVVAYDDYSFPDDSIKYEIIEHQEVNISKEIDGGNTTKTITLDSLKESSGSIGKLLEWSDKKTWSGESRFDTFFDSVQYVNGEIYIVCEVQNYLGETYAIVLNYDFDSEECKYVCSRFVGDRLNGDFYLVDEWHQ